jgi:deferrochelatase/peroxidase EfeB
MTRSDIDYADVQGIVRFGYGRLTEAAYLLLRVNNVATARAWLQSAPITNAVTRDSPPPTALQVAFTADGLRALNLPESVIDGFSPEFLTGMTEDNRARRLGDVENNAPWKWAWGGPGKVPHLIVMCFAGRGGLDGLVRETRESWRDGFDEELRLGTADLDGVEPFGFVDGISQPTIDWSQERRVTAVMADYSNIVALGEILLGYRNEYAKYTDRPLLDADAASAVLPHAEEASDKKDLGRNGTYLVVRQLEQDVRKFWQFIYGQTGGDQNEADKLAATFVGRTRNGEPLVPVQERAIAGVGPGVTEISQNQFTFDADPAGVGCPIGAHVRRANPRNADFPGRPTGLKRLIAALGLGRNTFGEDLTSPVRFHRILRRGREYGGGLSPADALKPKPANELERGLHFLCLNANISRQI